VKICCFCASVRSKKRSVTFSASPLWRSIALSRVSDPRSCIKRGPHTQAPKRRRAEFVRGILRPGLDDAVAGLDVMQQKIAVGMDDLVAERRRHGENAAIDQRARRRRRDGLDMADIAADPLEQRLAGLGIRPRRQVSVARWRLRTADELSEVVDIGQTKLSGTSSGSAVTLPIVVVSTGRKRLVTPISFK